VARKSTKSESTAPKKKPAAPKRKAAASSVKRGAASSGKNLVIVESPKKAKSIAKFLGSQFVVKASMGHVRDLPEKGQKGGLGIDVENNYAPNYLILPRKKDTVSELKKEADRASFVYLATDPDREGEAIAWHLQNALGLPDSKIQRVAFHEITERAVKEAFEHGGPIDMNRVNAQQARRFLDRFVGYQLSPLLWKKIARNLSAGRVQSVATRLIAEREKEIQAFVSEEYWKITATLAPAGSTAESERFKAELSQWNGAKFEAKNEEDARAIHDQLAVAPYVVSSVEQIEKSDKPEAPFKTSTLQQQGSIRLRFSGKRTMKLAQELYEGIDVDGSGPVGLITYMRTDSLRVSDDAISAVRNKIESEYGKAYLPAKPNRYAAGKQAQEAHEAIRPTDLSLSPERVKDKLTGDQLKLYQLIYRRFVASQMTPAVFAVTNVQIDAGAGLFKSQGKILKFDGYRKVLAPAGKQEDELLPSLVANQKLDLHKLDPTQHFTQPPPRFSEATLIKALEKENIGRPSTYAPIIQTIQDRGYVEQKERRFHATHLGLHVNDELVFHFPKILDLKFTAHMEDELDDIAQGKEEMIKVLDEFYHPFQEALKLADAQMERKGIPTDQVCQDCGAPMFLKIGRTGQFYSCSRYPECKATRPVNGDTSAKSTAQETEFTCAKCSKPLLLRENSRGPYLACSGYPDCKEIYNLDEHGRPVPREVLTEHKCPKCGKPMAMKKGPRGPFLGCTGYPKCRSTMPVDDQGKPVETPKIDVVCDKCGGPMGVKRGFRGPFLGCLAYPKCRSTKPIPEELKAQLGDVGTSASKGPDLKAVKVDVACEDCGSPMTVRRGKRGFFLGCSGYPKCKGTKEVDEGLKKEIEAQLASAPA
jgi:DNA topoisomerase I